MIFLNLAHPFFYSLGGSWLGAAPLSWGYLEGVRVWGFTEMQVLLAFSEQGLGKQISCEAKDDIYICPSPNTKSSSLLMPSSHPDISLRLTVFSVWALCVHPLTFTTNHADFMVHPPLIWQVCCSFVCSKSTHFSLSSFDGLWQRRHCVIHICIVLGLLYYFGGKEKGFSFIDKSDPPSKLWIGLLEVF